VYLVTLYIESI